MKTKPHHLLLSIHDVVLVDGKPAVITAPSMDDTSMTRRYSDTYVDAHWVNADGSLGNRFELNRKTEADYQHRVQPLDGCTVETRVTLPADLQQQLTEAEQQRKESVTTADERSADEYHPSYGAIRLSRISGHTKLFMSPFRHQHYIQIAISRAKKYRSMSDNRMHGDIRSLIRVEMSEAQFAKFITSAYDGNGTPCTLHELCGTYFPEPPEQDEADLFQKDVEDQAAQSAEFLDEAEKFANQLLNKPGTVTKAERKSLVDLIAGARRKLEDSLPFITRQLREKMEKVVADGQTEIESYMNNLVQRLGVKALQNEEKPISLLPPKKENE